MKFFYIYFSRFGLRNSETTRRRMKMTKCGSNSLPGTLPQGELEDVQSEALTCVCASHTAIETSAKVGLCVVLLLVCFFPLFF